MKKLKHLSWLLILFIFVAITNVGAADISEYESLILNVGISAVVTAEDYTDLTASLTLLPRADQRQEIISSEAWSDPLAEITEDDNLAYSWEDVKDVEFGLDAVVKTTVTFPGSASIPWPAVISENREYTKQSENIDSDNDLIKAKAAELAADKDDLFDVVFALGEWVAANITYDENYLEETFSASWVLQNRRGVCDEFSVLLIAFCRALGIPARYVSGVAYSNLKEEFGNHAWAEVWIPEHGWIPFDPTYNQLGWIDASHVALQKTLDTESAVLYTYLGDITLSTEEEVKVKLAEKLNKLTPKIDLRIEVLRKEVGPDSYIPLKLDFKNEQRHYLPLTAHLTKSPGLLGKNVKNILLKPGQEATEFFILQAPEEIKPGYRYESTIEVKTSFNNIAHEKVFFSLEYPTLGLDQAQEIIAAFKEEKLAYSVELECRPDRTEYYVGEEITINCDVSNKELIPLTDLELCIKQDCKSFNLDAGKSAEKIFVLQTEQTDFLIRLQNDKVKKSAYLSINLLEQPALQILDLQPRQLDYGLNNLSLTLSTKSMCKNLTIVINSLRAEAKSIDGKHTLPIPFAGRYALGDKIKIRVECYDLRGDQQTAEKTFSISVQNVPLLMKIWQFFLKVFG